METHRLHVWDVAIMAGRKKFFLWALFWDYFLKEALPRICSAEYWSQTPASGCLPRTAHTHFYSLEDAGHEQLLHIRWWCNPHCCQQKLPFVPAVFSALWKAMMCSVYISIYHCQLMDWNPHVLLDFAANAFNIVSATETCLGNTFKDSGWTRCLVGRRGSGMWASTSLQQRRSHHVQARSKWLTPVPFLTCSWGCQTCASGGKQLMGDQQPAHLHHHHFWNGKAAAEIKGNTP